MFISCERKSLLESKNYDGQIEFPMAIKSVN